MFPTERPGLEKLFGGSCAGMPLEPNGTPVHEAVRYRKKLVLQNLLEKGARIDIRDEDERMSMEVARKLGITNIVVLLQEFDAQEITTIIKALNIILNWAGRAQDSGPSITKCSAMLLL